MLRGMSTEVVPSKAAAKRGPLGHPLLEPLLFVGLALLFIWVVRPTRNDWLKTPLLVVIVAIPFLSAYLHGDSFRDLGLRLDNFWASARDVAAVTALGAVILVVIGLFVGSPIEMTPDRWRGLLLYPFWGLAQQFAMCSFTYRRVREGLGSPVVSASLTAALFASAHLPNWPLAAVTLLGGYVWCRLFEKTPNILTLAISHGWLAVLLRASWPAVWLHNLRIGPGYWTWTP